jgi:hypothetical protein
LLDGGFEVLTMPMSVSMEIVPTPSPTKLGFEVLLSMSMILPLETISPTSSPTSDVETPSAKTSVNGGGEAERDIPTDLDDTSTLRTASLSAQSSSASLTTGPMMMLVAAFWFGWCLF